MIVVDLQCEHGHSFEGWFASAAAFEQQLAQDLISCPSCGAVRVLRRPSAPYVQTRHAAGVAPDEVLRRSPATLETMTRELFAHLRHTARNLEDVGERFPEEARRIHYGDVEARGIKGKASGDEVRELLEEGIGVLPVPPDDDLH